jgi:hypothetical protein
VLALVSTGTLAISLGLGWIAIGALIAAVAPREGRVVDWFVRIDNRMPWAMRGHKRETTKADVRRNVLLMAGAFGSIGLLMVVFGIAN